MSPKTAGLFEDVFVEKGAWIWLRFRNPGKSKRQEARLNTMEQWKIRLTPQASTVPLTPHSLPLRISSGFLQVTESTPPFSTKGTPNRCCFLRASNDKRLPADKCRISKENERGALLKTAGTVPAVEQLQLQFHYLPVPVQLFFSSNAPSSSSFEILHMPGRLFPVCANPRKQRSAFSNAFLRGVWVAEVTSEWNLEK